MISILDKQLDRKQTGWQNQMSFLHDNYKEVKKTVMRQPDGGLIPNVIIYVELLYQKQLFLVFHYQIKYNSLTESVSGYYQFTMTLSFHLMAEKCGYIFNKVGLHID